MTKLIRRQLQVSVLDILLIIMSASIGIPQIYIVVPNQIVVKQIT